MESISKDYKYDVAISLCNQDAEFARKLKAQINPSLNVFFYEQNQEEIISKSGPEVFGRVFKESRIVIILSRKEWGETYYTGIEKSVILDRTSVKGEGYDFLMVIPMMPNEIPIWYPSTRIYANPQNSSVEELAKFIEFKVTEAGGVVRQLTLEDVHKHLLNRIAEKKKLIKLQTCKEALDDILAAIEKIEQIVNKKIEFIESTGYWATQKQSWHLPFGSCFAIEDSLLEIRILKPDETYQRIVSTQDYTLSIRLYKIIGGINNLYEESDNKQLIGTQNYKYLYSETLKGWSASFMDRNQITEKEASVLFRYRDPDNIKVTYWYYDLKSPATPDVLLDLWFQGLLKDASTNIEKYV